MNDSPRRVGQDATGADEGSFRPKNDATSPLSTFQLLSTSRRTDAACSSQKLYSGEV
jgi:hypothetical protein